MQLCAVTLALDAIPLMQPLLPRIQRRDKSLAVQLTRAASSAALNAAEGDYSDPGTRRARLHSAAGSANEARVALHVAIACGYLSPAEAQPALQQLDQVVALLWKLTH